MMRAILFACLLAFAAAAAAEAQGRPVLMRLCNDAPFAVGVAAAYATNPSGGRRAEGWFRVEANDCLEGAIHGVVGDRMSLAAFSGTWQWPAAGGDFTHCLPAQGFNTGLLDSPPCSQQAREVGFTTLPVRHFRQEWGMVDWRIGCGGQGEDAELCASAPAAIDGYSMPVRELEVCGPSLEGGLVALAEPVGAGQWRARGWLSLEPGECAIVYYGFPEGDRLYVHGHAQSESAVSTTRMSNPTEAVICVSQDVFDVSGTESELLHMSACPDDRRFPVPFERVRFRPDVSRFTHFFRAGG